MKFYVESLKCGRDAFNILSKYPKISNYKTEEIIKETNDGEKALHYLAIYFKTPKDILKAICKPSSVHLFALPLSGKDLCDSYSSTPNVTARLVRPTSGAERKLSGYFELKSQSLLIWSYIR